MILGEKLSSLLQGGDVVLLDGDLGAGKTHFAKGVAKGVGVEQALTSPTFNLVLEYPLAKGLLFHDEKNSVETGQNEVQPPRLLRHFDLYRLECAEQLEDIDYFGLIEQSDAVSLVEWGSKFSESLPLDYLLIQIEVDSGHDNARTLELSARGARAEELLSRYAVVIPTEVEQHE